MMAERQFLFVCGLHRSGTSLLFRALRDHSQISGFRNTGASEDEGQHLQSVYKPSGAYGSAGRFGFAPEAHLTEHSALATAANGVRLMSEWSRYWDLSRPVLLEKSPPNLIRTRFLQALFPDAYFVILLRHPVAVAYATQRWYGRRRVYTRSLASLLDHWLVCHDIFCEDRPFLRRTLVLHYEHFVAEPDRILRRIADFVGLAPEPCRQQVRRDVNDRYFQRWRDRLLRPVVGWRTERLIARLEPRVRAYGYSLSDLERVEALS